MVLIFCLLIALFGCAVASPQIYGLPTKTLPPSPVFSDFTSQGGQYVPSQTLSKAQFTNQVFPAQITQTFSPTFERSSQSNGAFYKNQFTNPKAQTSSPFQTEFLQAQITNPSSYNPFNRPPARSGIENHPFLHGNTLELLPPLQHVVGTKYPRVEAGVGFRFPTSQLLNTTPPPNLL